MHPALNKYFEGKINFSPEHEILVSSCFKIRSTTRNEMLIQKGTVARNLYFVVKGCLRVFLTADDGKEYTRFLIFEGRMGTAFPSFILKEPSVASVQSIKPSELMVLSYTDREMLQKEVPGWETMDRIGVEHEYIAAIQRIESLISLSSNARYTFLLKNNPEIIQRLPSKIAADYLGISQETLSRLKSKK